MNDTSYNDYHQIVKYYEYKGGRIFRVQKKLSRIEGCEIICDNEYIYKNEKIVKVLLLGDISNMEKYSACEVDIEDGYLLILKEKELHAE